jgi:hypothetical protein
LHVDPAMQLHIKKTVSVGPSQSPGDMGCG